MIKNEIYEIIRCKKSESSMLSCLIKWDTEFVYFKHCSKSFFTAQLSFIPYSDSSLLNYLQIYIAREIHRKERGIGNLSNQTVTHTIYKIPFNYPAAQKPRIVAESGLTHCWDKDASTQVGFLYNILNFRLIQGICKYCLVS